MKNPLRQPLFLIALGSYFILFALKKSQVYLPFISDYAADFLTLPVVLSIALFGIRRLVPERQNYRFTIWHVVFTVGMYGFLFEWLFPRLDTSTTADPWDLLAYALGGLVFWLWMNDCGNLQPQNSQQSGF